MMFEGTRKGGDRSLEVTLSKTLDIPVFLLAEVPLQQAFEGLAVTGFVALAIAVHGISFFVPSGRRNSISFVPLGLRTLEDQDAPP